jgi:hypothetical protein
VIARCFRTPQSILEVTAAALAEFGPFGQGLDVCCGTGVGMLVLRPVWQGPDGAEAADHVGEAGWPYRTVRFCTVPVL